MIAGDRKARAKRTTALTFALMSEVLLGGTLLAVLRSQTMSHIAVLGVTGTVVVVTVGMALLTVNVVLVMFAPPLRRGVLVAWVGVFTIAIAFVGVIAIEFLTLEPSVGFLLAFGCILTIPSILEVSRSSAARNRM